jgi:hypothetical protein
VLIVVVVEFTPLSDFPTKAKFTPFTQQQQQDNFKVCLPLTNSA